jgi:uncharacterized protein
MRRKLTLAVVLCAVVFGAVLFFVGSALMAPRPSAVPLPHTLARAETVVFPSASGSQIHGWFLQGAPGAGAVLLLHGAEGTRLQMAERARWLADESHSVLLIDFQANGESPGEHVTFGYLEARDAQAAVAWLKSRVPGERIGLIGASMGGAAAALADPPLDVDAMVLEEVYPTIVEAVDNRLALHLGRLGKFVSPALTLQIRPRLGVDTDDLRPIERVRTLHMPKLFVAGELDHHTTLEQSQALFAAAAEPKELWVVPGAGHLDLLRFEPEAYRQHVGTFLAAALRR